MVKIQITRAVAVRGVHHDVGDVVEVDDLTARALMALRRAVPAPEEEAAPAEPSNAGGEPAETTEGLLAEENAAAAPAPKKKKAA